MTSCSCGVHSLTSVKSFSFQIRESCVGWYSNQHNFTHWLKDFCAGERKENKFIHQMHRKVNPNFGSYPMDNYIKSEHDDVNHFDPSRDRTRRNIGWLVR